MKKSKSGQALVEWALLLPLYVVLCIAIAKFGEWFAIRHELLAAVRQGAFLYSSGRLTSEETKTLVQKTLEKSFPSIHIPREAIYVGRYKGFQARLFRLDEVRIRFRGQEEKCVIKHAPSYWQTLVPGVNVGPPESW